MKINKYSLYYGFGFFISTFILLYVGIHFFLGSDLVFKNYVAYLAFSTIVGLVFFIFASFKQKSGLLIFTLAYLIAFVSMFYSFSQKLDGWQDLIGLLQMMLILGVGLVLSVIIQIIIYYKNK